MKKILSFILVAAMLVLMLGAFTACGDKTNTAEETGETTGENANAAPNKPAEPESRAAAAGTDDGDFESVFGTEGEEADTDLFGNTASAAGTAARVSAADALNRIKSFDFSL